MYIKQINRGASDQVFIAVKNTGATVCSVGHCVFWDFPIVASGTGTGSGYQVKHDAAAATTTQAVAPHLAAGVVAAKDIPVGDYGSIQVYGFCDNVRVTGTTAAPFYGTLFATTDRASASFTNARLVPLALVPGAAATNLGYMAPVTVATTLAATQLDLRPFWNGVPYAVPVGNVNGNVSLVSTSSGSVKAFLKFL